ncbi:MAG: hypothetical protein AB1714_16090 [Acidobacteriota bacterium]
MGHVDSLTEVIWAVDPRKDDIGGLIARIRKFSSEVFDAKGIAWEMHVPQSAQLVRVESHAKGCG